METSVYNDNENSLVKTLFNEVTQKPSINESRTDVTYIQSSYSSCFNDFMSLLEGSNDNGCGQFIIIDDLFSLGDDNDSIVRNIRKLRSFIENSFGVIIIVTIPFIAILTYSLSSLWTRHES